MRPDLTKAAEILLAAEYAFRCGPIAYTTLTTECYLRAERDMRRALTGKGDLCEAYASMLATRQSQTK